MKKYILLIISFYISFAYTQNEYSTCNVKFIAEENQVIDSVQFFINYGTNIDTENEDCLFSLRELCMNTVPWEGVHRYCILFIENDKKIEMTNYMLLFDSESETSIKEKIKLVFISDVNTGFYKAFYGDSELKNAFKINLLSDIH
jgi:hypothetical protein